MKFDGCPWNCVKSYPPNKSDDDPAILYYHDIQTLAFAYLDAQDAI